MTAEKASTDLILCPSHQSHTVIKRICYAAILASSLECKIRENVVQSVMRPQ